MSRPIIRPKVPNTASARVARIVLRGGTCLDQVHKTATYMEALSLSACTCVYSLMYMCMDVYICMYITITGGFQPGDGTAPCEKGAKEFMLVSNSRAPPFACHAE